MSVFAEQRRALVDLAFAAFGDDALWAGSAARIRLKTMDEDARFGGASLVERVTIVRVRSWDVAQPARGDLVETALATWSVVSRPMLDRKGVWDCPVERVE